MNKSVKDKVISFRVDSNSFKELQRLSKASGVGTAHNFVRELAERVISGVGAVGSWNVNNEIK